MTKGHIPHMIYPKYDPDPSIIFVCTAFKILYDILVHVCGSI